MAGLSGQIKYKVAALYFCRHRSGVSHIVKIDYYLVTDVVDVEKVSAVLWNQTVDQRDFCAERDQTSGQRGTYETKPAGDEHIGVRQYIEVEWHR